MPDPPPRAFRHEPTGQARFRRGWRGQLILEIEFRNPVRDPAFGEDQLYWADAIADDIWRLRWHRAHKKLAPLL